MLSDSSFATVDQLGAFLQQPLESTDPAAQLMLNVASDMVRDYLQQTLSFVPVDVVYLDPIDPATVILPELPVISVDLVEIFDGVSWSTVDPAVLDVSKRTGVIHGVPNSGVTWPGKSESWRVTYSHGFEAVPDSILGVVLGVAGRAYSSPVGVDQERIGSYQVRYSMQADGFSPIEKMALNRYVVARVA